jgi:hypothetical protein
MYKGCFGLEKIGSATITATSVSTLFYNGTGVSPPFSSVIPVVTFNVVGQTMTLFVNTSGGGSVDQNFMTTLISFPTATIRGGNRLEDFIIAAI